MRPTISVINCREKDCGPRSTWRSFSVPGSKTAILFFFLVVVEVQKTFIVLQFNTFAAALVWYCFINNMKEFFGTQIHSCIYNACRNYNYFLVL